MDKFDLKTQKMINDMIEVKLKAFLAKNVSIRSFTKLGSVKDVYSPITGNSKQIGFFGTPKISQPTVTGSKGGNAALTSLLTALKNLGLVIDNSS